MAKTQPRPNAKLPAISATAAAAKTNVLPIDAPTPNGTLRQPADHCAARCGTVGTFVEVTFNEIAEMPRDRRSDHGGRAGSWLLGRPRAYSCGGRHGGRVESCTFEPALVVVLDVGAASTISVRRAAHRGRRLSLGPRLDQHRDTSTGSPILSRGRLPSNQEHPHTDIEEAGRRRRRKFYARYRKGIF